MNGFCKSFEKFVKGDDGFLFKEDEDEINDLTYLNQPHNPAKPVPTTLWALGLNPVAIPQPTSKI